MNLSQYVEHGRGRQTELARLIGAQPQLVWQWSRGVRPVPIARCAAIERATGGLVTRRELRPDDWHIHWPELVGTDGPSAMPEPKTSALPIATASA